MKKILKWFTLVEILIVIVIIGILIWALVPRMSAAQGRARDVARKNDLSNLQAAIVVAYQDLWRYPCTNAGGCLNWDEVTAGGTQAKEWVNILALKSRLEAAWMNTVPRDPLWTNTVSWLWTSSAAAWDYRYITVQSHGIPDWWFVLMAKTEVAWSSNWVVCDAVAWEHVECQEDGGEGTTPPSCPCSLYPDWCTEWGSVWAGQILNTDDVKNLRLCDSLTQWAACSNTVATTADWTQTERTCVYKDERDLRYIVMY